MGNGIWELKGQAKPSRQNQTCSFDTKPKQMVFGNWCVRPNKILPFGTKTNIGPIRVRALPLGFRHTARWPLYMAFFSLSSLFFRLIANSPRSGCRRVPKSCTKILGFQSKTNFGDPPYTPHYAMFGRTKGGIFKNRPKLGMMP